MNYRRILPLALSLLSTLLAGSPYARGAEMRSFALAEVLPTNGLPPHSGVAYTLPRTRVRVAVTLVVDKVTETTENHASDGEVTTTQGPPQFEVVLDTNTLPELTITSEDDPALAFYLVSDGGFLTDITGGAITYFEGSTRINTIGVAYEDKTAEAIAGTLKLLGEVAGTVLAGLGPMSTDAKKLITRRERMEGVSAKVEEAFNLVDKLSGIETNKVITTLNLVPAVAKLQKQVGERLHAEGVAIASHPFITHKGKTYGVDLANGKLVDSNSRGIDVPEMRLEINAGAVMRPETAAVWVASALNHTKVGGQNRKYVPGVVYRAPAEGTMRLTFDGQGVAEKRQRIPEAGKAGWIELSSKVFGKVSPSITFRADGGLSEYHFAATTKYTEALKMLEEANTSAKSVIDQLKAAEAAKRTAEQTSAQSEAAKALKLEKVKFELAEKQAEIKQLEAQLAAAAPDARASIEANLRKAKADLVQLELRFKWLEKGVEVGP